jgi:hypothetical protein
VLRLLVRKRVTTIAIALLALIISFLPTAVLNTKITGDWTGDPNNSERIRLKNHLSGLIGNGICAVIENLNPPVLPAARRVNQFIEEHLPRSIKERLQRDFPRFQIGLGDLAQEENAGLGLGIVTILVGSSLIIVARKRNRQHRSDRDRTFRWAILAGAWIACFAYMAIAGSESTARLLSAYYPLLIAPFLLASAYSSLVRSRLWNGFAFVCSASILPSALVSPAHPLLPLTYFVQSLPADSAVRQRLISVYEVYSRRNDLLAPIRERLPSEATSIGLIAGINDSEVALWRPFGRRSVHHLVAEHRTHPEFEWIVVKQNALPEENGYERWLGEVNGSELYSTNITSLVRVGPEKWSIVRLKPKARD